MLADAQSALSTAPMLAIYPGIAIVIAALGFTLVGRADARGPRPEVPPMTDGES